jgi:hypothetical protein
MRGWTGKTLTRRAPWLKGLYPYSVAIYFAATAALLVEFNWNLILFFIVIGLLVDLLVKIDNRISLYASLACLLGLVFVAYYIIRFHLLPSEVTCLPLDICVRSKYFDNLPAGQVSSAAMLKAGIVDVLKLLSIGGLCFLFIAHVAQRNVRLPPMPEDQKAPLLVIGMSVFLTILAVLAMTDLPRGMKRFRFDWSHVRDLSDVYFTYFLVPGGLGYMFTLIVCAVALMNSIDEDSFFNRPWPEAGRGS